MAYGHGFHQYSVVWPGDAVSHVVATRGRRFEPRGPYVVDPLVRWARKGAQVRCEDFALKKTKECAQGGLGGIEASAGSAGALGAAHQGARQRGDKNAVETTTAKKKREKRTRERTTKRGRMQ